MAPASCAFGEEIAAPRMVGRRLASTLGPTIRPSEWPTGGWRSSLESSLPLTLLDDHGGRSTRADSIASMTVGIHDHLRPSTTIEPRPGVRNQKVGGFVSLREALAIDSEGVPSVTGTPHHLARSRDDSHQHRHPNLALRQAEISAAGCRSALCALRIFARHGRGRRRQCGPTIVRRHDSSTEPTQ
jgi:hypothetical protein